MSQTKHQITGTKEWASSKVNCVSGCFHNCRYCYAKAMALRFKRIMDGDDWAEQQVRWKEVERRRRRTQGTIMFPTSHDITPETLGPCLAVLRKLLAVENRVLVVSKPHLDCIMAICDECQPYRQNILFRFSIGATSNETLSYWEPNAPTFEERLACLELAYQRGFKTSVSIEPILDTSEVVDLIHRLTPFITDSIWLGKMNRIRNCFRPETEQDELAIQKIESGQTDEKIMQIYGQLKDHPLVKWKESIKKVMGLELATEAGLDA